MLNKDTIYTMVLEKYAQWLPGATLCRPKHSKRLVPKSIELGIVLPKLYPADIGVTAEKMVADALARQLIKEWSRMTKVFVPKELEINTAKDGITKVCLYLEDVTEEGK